MGYDSTYCMDRWFLKIFRRSLAFMFDLSFPMHVKQDDNYYPTSVGSSLILFRAGSTPSSARSARWGPTHMFSLHT